MTITKTWKKVIVAVLMVAFVLAFLPALPTKAAATDYAGEFEVYIAFGGDKEAENDWGYNFGNPGNAGNTPEITATTATAKVGDTVTVSLEFPTPVVNAWYFAPVINGVANATSIDASISLKIDGEDYPITTFGKGWWYEGTGDYADAIRLAGGFNEWATKYIEEPSNFTKLEYTITFNSIQTDDAAVAAATTPYTGEVEVYVAFGGDKEAENDWGFNFSNPGNAGNTPEITATTATAKAGDTVTVGLEFPSPVVNAWYFAPVINGVTDVANVDATISLKIDDQPVGFTDFAQLAWAEGTGDYADAVRLAGGFNEWATKYIEEPANFTKIEYTITFNAIETAAAVEGGVADFDGEVGVYVGFGGDKEAENDWAFQYNDPNNAGNAGDIVATTATAKVGDTVTVGLEFPSPVFNTWWMAPVLTGITDAANVDATVTLKIDDQEVAIDASKGDAWWPEATGDVADAVRLAGGFNEWAIQYIEEPAGFTKVEYTITINKIEVSTGEAAPSSAAGEVNLDTPEYHAYIGLQTPAYSFRNEWYEANYGMATEYFNQVTGWDADGGAVVYPGTFNDVVIDGNGTYTVSVEGLELPEADFASQEYMNLIFFSTDIPNTGAITFSDVTLKIDGKTVDTPKGGVLNEDADYCTIMMQNAWVDDIKTIGYYNVPMKKMTITFTVSGFNCEGTVQEAEATTAAATEAATEASATEAVTEAAKKGLPTGGIIGIVVAVLAVAGIGAGVAVGKKKKN